MAEFAGIAASLEIFNLSRFFSVPISAFVVWWIVVKGTYKSIEKIFLFACLFYVAYIISGVYAKPDWNEVFIQTIKPNISWNLNYIVMLVGLVGTTIAPWMQFYLQASIVDKGVKVEEYNHLKLDVISGCIIAPVVAFFIIVACAATMFESGVPIESARDAALALKPLAGEYASFLFAFGLFNASIFAASILPISTAYSICEGLGWDAGLDKRFEEAPQFFTLYAFIIIIGAGVVLMPNFPLLLVMFLSQVGNGILLPFVLIYMLRLINNKEIMGEFANNTSLNIITWITVVITIILNLLMVLYTFLNL